MFRKKDKNQGIPDGVVGNNLKNARLTKKEREEIATTERKRIRKQMEAEAERYQIIKSTQRIIPVEDIFNGVIITKDHRYVKVMEYRPINFAYMDAETQNRVISLFYQTFKAVPCNIQFKTFARKADVESTISNVTQYYEQETNPISDFFVRRHCQSASPAASLWSLSSRKPSAMTGPGSSWLWRT